LSEFDSTDYSVRSTKVFSVFRLFLDVKIIVWPWAMILSSKNNRNMGHTFVDHYILWINFEYGLFLCLPEIDNSKIQLSLGLLPVAKSAVIIYLFFTVVFQFCPQETSCYVPGDGWLIFVCLE